MEINTTIMKFSRLVVTVIGKGSIPPHRSQGRLRKEVTEQIAAPAVKELPWALEHGRNELADPWSSLARTTQELDQAPEELQAAGIENSRK